MVYENQYQHVYKVIMNFRAVGKNLLVMDYGKELNYQLRVQKGSCIRVNIFD